MSATPIPRSLMLACFGDIACSRLDEKPPGRTPVRTRAMPIEPLERVVGAVQRAVDEGDRVYWICPLVAESEQVDAAAAESRFATLAEAFGTRVGLVHGQLPAVEKTRAMEAFASGDIDVLVATSVIEVGVDVPEASVMVIEHAERFGLAQLHQLRGRVGRGTRRSTCLLLYAMPLSQMARERLRIMRETDDGFAIAEADLRLRGPGEALGARQSGGPAFRLADPVAHSDLFLMARDDARLTIERDPQLESGRGRALRQLLELFGRDEAMECIRAG